jgi:hypothetical protein
MVGSFPADLPQQAPRSLVKTGLPCAHDATRASFAPQGIRIDVAGDQQASRMSRREATLTFGSVRG